MYQAFASNYTQNDLTAARTVAAGSIHVYGFLLSNNTGGEVVVTLADAAGTAIMILVVADNSVFQMEIPFLADGGVTISEAGDAAVEFTMFHSNVAGAA
jgi:hypothetical protein